MTIGQMDLAAGGDRSRGCPTSCLYGEAFTGERLPITVAITGASRYGVLRHMFGDVVDENPQPGRHELCLDRNKHSSKICRHQPYLSARNGSARKVRIITAFIWDSDHNACGHADDVSDDAHWHLTWTHGGLFPRKGGRSVDEAV